MEILAQISHFKPVLDELEALLSREREALRCLNQDALAEATEGKLRIDEELTRIGRSATLTLDERAQLVRIRRDARINQLLLVHARSCVQGALQLVTGETYQTPSLRQSPTLHSPLAVNLRG